jgi:hypothetical protein
MPPSGSPSAGSQMKPQDSHDQRLGVSAALISGPESSSGSAQIGRPSASQGPEGGSAPRRLALPLSFASGRSAVRTAIEDGSRWPCRTSQGLSSQVPGDKVGRMPPRAGPNDVRR